MNESPYPPPRLAVEYVSKYAEYMNVYYVEELREELIEELEKYSGLPREYIEFYPSSSHVLTLMAALAKALDLEVVMPHPTFHVLYPLFRGFRVKYIPIKLSESFELNVEVFLKLAEGKLVYLANPNNPTGNMLLANTDYVAKLAKVARYVFVDEVYYEFSGFTAKDLVPEFDNVVAVRSLSKAFSLAGARFGYVLAGKNAMRALNSLRIGFETPVTTQAAALGALREKAYMERVVREIASTRDYVRGKLAETGFWGPPSKTNFILVDLNAPCRNTWAKLRERGILTMCLENTEDFGEYANYLRVTIGKRKDMEYFLETLLSILQPPRVY